MIRPLARLVLKQELTALNEDLEIRKAWSDHWFKQTLWFSKKLEAAETKIAQYEAKRTCKHCGKVFNEPPAMYHHLSKGRCPKLKEKPVPLIPAFRVVKKEPEPVDFAKFEAWRVEAMDLLRQARNAVYDPKTKEDHRSLYRRIRAVMNKGEDLAPKPVQKEHELPMQGLG